MKLISKMNRYKAVKYFGLDIQAPYWTNFMATDHNGDVNAFFDEPSKGNVFWMKKGHSAESTVATVDLEGMDWRETLMEVEG